MGGPIIYREDDIVVINGLAQYAGVTRKKKRPAPMSDEERERLATTIAIVHNEVASNSAKRLLWLIRNFDRKVGNAQLI